MKQSPAAPSRWSCSSEWGAVRCRVRGVLPQAGSLAAQDPSSRSLEAPLGAVVPGAEGVLLIGLGGSCFFSPGLCGSIPGRGRHPPAVRQPRSEPGRTLSLRGVGVMGALLGFCAGAAGVRAGRTPEDNQVEPLLPHSPFPGHWRRPGLFAAPVPSQLYSSTWAPPRARDQGGVPQDGDVSFIT